MYHKSKVSKLFPENIVKNTSVWNKTDISNFIQAAIFTQCLNLVPQTKYGKYHAKLQLNKSWKLRFTLIQLWLVCLIKTPTNRYPSPRTAGPQCSPETEYEEAERIRSKMCSSPILAMTCLVLARLCEAVPHHGSEAGHQLGGCCHEPGRAEASHRWRGRGPSSAGPRPARGGSWSQHPPYPRHPPLQPVQTSCHGQYVIHGDGRNIRHCR